MSSKRDMTALRETQLYLKKGNSFCKPGASPNRRFSDGRNYIAV